MDISRFLNLNNRWQLVSDVFIWFLSGFTILRVVDIASEKIVLPDYITGMTDFVKGAAFFLALVIVFILFKDFLKLCFRLFKSNKVYVFKSQNFPKEWIFNGKTEINSATELFVKSSRAGCLLNNFYWKNFCMTFEMKFRPNRVRPLMNLGLVFRAEDLDNYFMLEIIQDNNFDGNTISGIGPQVRFNGGWDGARIEEMNFDFLKWTKVVMEVRDENVNLYIKGKLVFNWVLPTHVDINLWETGVKDNSEIIKDEMSKINHVRKVPFRLSYGKVGFRAHMLQGAIVKGLKIEPL